jgi:tetratricopeptide (TPR) repeat protein
MNLPVVLRVAPEKMERLFAVEKDMIGSLTERDRGKLAEAVSACEGLAEDIRNQIADVREVSNKAEGSIEEAAKFLATVAASGIDEKVAAAYDESRRMLEEAKSLFERGDAETALARAQTARTKLETEVLEPQDSIRREWIELSHRADKVLERGRAVDMALAARATPEQVERLVETERNMAVALCERNSDALAEAVSICEGLIAEIEPAATGLSESLRLAAAASSQLVEEVNSACSPDAMVYCPGLVNSLRINSARMAANAAANDLPKLEASIATVEGAIASIGAEVEAKKSRRHGELSEQLKEIEGAVQEAVQQCAGNYSPDMLEDAYIDLNRIRDSLSAGAEALTAESDLRQARDLAVARTKVWQVEFMRERFEQEREEILRQLQLKLGAAREAIDTCAGLDFIDESSPLMQEARELLGHVDNLNIEGEVDASFEQIREVDALANRIMSEAEQNRREWQKLSDRLMADDASHKSILSDPAAEKVSEEERRNLSELDARTEAIRDSRDIGALRGHAQELTRGAVAVTGLVEAWKQENRTEIRAKLSDTGREIRLAELMGAKNTCPDVFSAAITYLDIANTYLAKEDFDSAHPAVEDALEKAREASSLAKASMQRESSLALDYMKIAAAHIEQQNLEAATEALRRGLSLAQSAMGEEAPQPDSEDSPE